MTSKTKFDETKQRTHLNIGKLRGMHAMMNRAVDKLGDYLNTVIQKSDGKMNIKEVIIGFTIDVIATTR